MRIGIFGGTFDPPHLGHLILAEEAYYQLELDLVLWVPTSNPPHKPRNNITDIHQRLVLVETAIHDNSHFEISKIEVNRSPPQYAVDTIQRLKNMKPVDEFIYLMGADSLVNLHTWYKPDQFVQLCDGLGIMRRPDTNIILDDIETHLPGIRLKIKFINTPLIEISGSLIRGKIKKGHAYRYYLPEKVSFIIEKQKLYR